MQHEFTGKVVFVTGGSKGAGRGICQCFVDQGATVVACARRPPERPLPGVIFKTLDILDAQAVTEFFSTFPEEFGRLDCLVNNAGGAPPAEAASASLRFSEKILALNLLAPIHLAQAAYRIMQGQADGGSIVNIASVAALRPSPGTAVYGAAKAGLVHLTRSLAMEWAPKVRVNAIAAGLIHTEQAQLHYGDAAGIAAVAQNRGIQLNSVTATLEGDLNILGILGGDPEVRNGFNQVRVHYDIDADASSEDIEALVAQSQKRSAVFDIVTNPTNVAVTVN